MGWKNASLEAAISIDENVLMPGRRLVDTWTVSCVESLLPRPPCGLPIPDPESQIPELPNLDVGIWSLQFEIWNIESEIWDIEYGIPLRTGKKPA